MYRGGDALPYGGKKEGVGNNTVQWKGEKLETMHEYEMKRKFADNGMESEVQGKQGTF